MQLDQLGLEFSPARIVMTKFGERAVRSAPANEQFWNVWKTQKIALKELGVSVSKQDNGWTVTHWAQTIAREERAATAAASRATDVNQDFPIGEGYTYLPYQKAGIAYALGRQNVLIADEMGLGKTLQAIGVCNTTNARRILVVCPASLRINWSREIGRFQTLGLPVHIIQAGDEWPSGNGWFVVNYDIIGRYNDQTKASAWDVLILDECHYLKNSKAKRTQQILGGGNGAKAIPAARKVLLTGTPILNRPIELFTLINALDPARWGSWFGYAKRYCDAHNNGFGWDVSGASNLDELQARLRETCMVRRLKADVLTELPPKRRQVIALATTAVTRKLVEAEEAMEARHAQAIADASYAAQKAEEAGDDIAYKAAVAKLHTIQGIAFTEMAQMRHDVALAKVPQIVQHLEDVSGQVVVFAHHRDVVAALVDALKDRGVVQLTGDTPMQARQDAVDKFQAGKAQFFVGNIKAAGVGWTLTASSHVVFAELDWTPGWVRQAEDRCHRIGQHDNVLVQHIVLDGSLDARMVRQLVQKQDVADQALDVATTVDIAGKDPEVFVTVEDPAEVAAREAKEARRQALDEVAATLTMDQIKAIHGALRVVAAMDSDSARDRNDVGFSKIDTRFGQEMAAQATLSPRQAAICMRLARKYRRQYDVALYTRIFGEGWE